MQEMNKLLYSGGFCDSFFLSAASQSIIPQ